jgi:CopG family transcriptional regulator, nickel-responsive regulator
LREDLYIKISIIFTQISITMTVTRFSISLEQELLDELDMFANDNNFANRSQAVRHLIEKNIVEKKWHCNNLVAGAIVMIYDHHKKDISSVSNDIQHNYFDVILSSQHYHLSHDICLEIIAVKGYASILTELSEKLISIKGIKHGKLVMSKSD